MADITEVQLLAQVAKLAEKLDRRAKRYRLLERYYEGTPPYPEAIRRAKLTRAYRLLMPMAEAPWGSLVVGSVLDRLEVAGIRDQHQAAADAVWGAWQDQSMDSESKLAHASALISGRAFALVWPGDAGPEISLDSSEQMIVQYLEGSRRQRVAALRAWVDDDETKYATLYRPDGIYKYRQPKPSDRAPEGASWVRREVAGEAWPVPNPFGIVPVVEIAVNRRLKPGEWGYARGEYEHCLGLIDRIQLLVFLGLVVSFWMGFPLRGVIGDRILRDDDNNVIPPFEADPGTVFQIENPDAKIAEYRQANRTNLSVIEELTQLAAITKTPRHYFPLAQAMSHISADAIRADEGGLNAKTVDHKGSLGEGWEETLRVGGRMLDRPVDLSARAELVWKNHESRSLAEMADAATKLKDILPPQMLGELVLNLTQEQIARMTAQRASDALGQLLTAATSAPSANGRPAVPAPAAP